MQNFTMVFEIDADPADKGKVYFCQKCGRHRDTNYCEQCHKSIKRSSN